MGNFEFLKKYSHFASLVDFATEAERFLKTSPTFSAMMSRKTAEQAVKWLYHWNYWEIPYKAKLGELINNADFRSALKNDVIHGHLNDLVLIGNEAAHEGVFIPEKKAHEALVYLHQFLTHLARMYGKHVPVPFDNALIPNEMVPLDPERIKRERELQAELENAQSENEDLKKKLEEEEKKHQEEIEKLRAEYEVKLKQQPVAAGTETEDVAEEELSEYDTRKIFIDFDLREMGWVLDDCPTRDVIQEYHVNDMEGHIGQDGYVDYVLFDVDGLPLAVVEAKKTTKDPNVGRTQAVLYADCLEREFGRRPFMFTTNGFSTYFWDDKTSPQRKVSMIFSKSDLQKLMLRRENRKDLGQIAINEKITDRYYQIGAIRAVCEKTMQGIRKHLLVMATGTGKTRTSSSLVDVMSRGEYITNVLFLADRIALVRQAKEDFKNYLPDMSLCNLLENKDDKNARIVFSTYPTILNAIDTARTKDGKRMFTPAHFDLIIIDEAHRSIFKKYRAIFEYFDAVLVGLTATPKKDVDKNTYDFFGLADEDPTYAYDYDTAVKTDHYLVPYHNIEVTTKFMHDGISYDDLSPDDKERYEADFAEDDEELPSFVSAEKLNRTVFNQNTIDIMLQDLMNNGLMVASGERLAKTIIFAQNKRHAEFILERFNALFPEKKGKFAQRVICDDSYAQSVIDNFKQPAPPTQYCYEDEKEPHIVISVDMMDTGIDVPHIGNLVFFKEVFSKTKFWQMIGRGTRKCQGMECKDSIDGCYTDKRRFYIFDYCMNFEFFRVHQDGLKGKETPSLTESIFVKRVRIIEKLQDPKYAGDKERAWRDELVKICQDQILSLNDELITVKLEKEYVVKYRKPDAFQYISEKTRGELIEHIAHLVKSDDQDLMAKRFDNFMYGLILAKMDDNYIVYEKSRNDLQLTAKALERRSTIPQIGEKVPVIRDIYKQEFWEDADILRFEMLRKELRGLIQFISREEDKTVYTALTDTVLRSTEGVELPTGNDFYTYRQRVEQYILEHKDNTAIYKLTHNKPMTEEDYKNLEIVLTRELGNKEDYEKNYGETPFGLLVRKIAKMDHQAAMEAFSAFINDQSLNTNQINFVQKVIAHIENNGYMENMNILLKAPFEKPISFRNLFDYQRQIQLRDAIEQVKKNALIAQVL